MSVEFLVRIPFDLPWNGKAPSRSWVKNRIGFFNRVTLRSLRNQTFDGFRIVLDCG